MESCEVKGVRMAGNRFEQLLTTRGDLEAGLVVITTGVWCNSFLEQA
ncbi:MAG: hypothetical protein QW470_01485 [Candidatus Caldarchaeum sp.]